MRARIVSDASNYPLLRDVVKGILLSEVARKIAMGVKGCCHRSSQNRSMKAIKFDCVFTQDHAGQFVCSCPIDLAVVHHPR